MPNHKRPRITKTCLNCGKTFEVRDTEADRKFCSRKCTSSTCLTPTETRVCRGCGKSFEAMPSDTRVEFCSRSCANRRHWGPPIVKTCIGCGQTFEVDTWHQSQVYCCRQCFYDHRATKPRVCLQCHRTYTTRNLDQKFCSPECQQLASRRRITKTCKHCGTTFETLECKSTRRQYCSKRCHNMHKHYSGESRVVLSLFEQVLNEVPVFEHSFDWLVSPFGGRMHLDAYFPGHRLAFEYDGRQHREYMPHFHRSVQQFERTQARDRAKEHLCAQHGITLVRFTDEEPRTLEHVIQRLSGIQIGSGSLSYKQIDLFSATSPTDAIAHLLP